MKTTLILFAFGLLVAVSAAQKYTTKYDNINVDQILSNDRLLKAYINCLLEPVEAKARCTAEGRELKRVLPDALETECQKCSEKQKKDAEKVIDYLSKNKRDDWEKILDKYDQKGVYRARYNKEAEKRGIKV